MRTERTILIIVILIAGLHSWAVHVQLTNQSQIIGLQTETIKELHGAVHDLQEHETKMWSAQNDINRAVLQAQP